MMARRIIFLIFFATFFCSSYAQDSKEGTGPKQKSIQSERKGRKADRREAREQRRKERAERKAIKKHHKRIQSKETLRQMMRTKRKSILLRQNKPVEKRSGRKKKV